MKVQPALRKAPFVARLFVAGLAAAAAAVLGYLGKYIGEFQAVGINGCDVTEPRTPLIDLETAGAEEACLAEVVARQHLAGPALPACADHKQ